MPYLNGHNMSGYSPDPDNTHVFADVDGAREDHAETLRRWSDECDESSTDDPDEQIDLQSIGAELALDAETTRSWIGRDGGSTTTRGPDRNAYTFWTMHKTLDELRSDGWTERERRDAGIID
jgi:hypothetical protein